MIKNEIENKILNVRRRPANMRKILKVGKPLSATYSHSAHTLSILAAEDDNKGWLLNCFVQLFGDRCDFLDYQDFGFMECPIIDTQHIGIDMVDIGWKSRIDFIKMAIINDYYVYAELNTSKIKAYGQSVVFAHDALIYGFDEENKQFLIADFFQHKKYGNTWIEEDELKNAIYMDEGCFGKTGIFNNEIFLLKPHKNTEAIFSNEKVRETLGLYESGKPLLLGYNNRFKPLYPSEKNKYLYGINCYQMIYEMIENAKIEKNLPIRWRQVIYLFYEHKKIMCERLCYMGENNYLKNSQTYINMYQYIEKNMETILCLFIKYSLTYDEKILKRILEIIEKVNKDEKNILPDLIGDIR